MLQNDGTTMLRTAVSGCQHSVFQVMSSYISRLLSATLKAT
jgi:hypothetical protein